ncbi:hypothetical protein KO507_13655 [Gilvimarinus agarilyticus]|uniref:hypothetical protein n=1 Tax=unclassified Gilvimarinus TaxID=2642066 RepID=UPI001C0A522D|nr:MULTISPECIES: hypothetical protein [unclassified Gilvimarinus]MBU2886813.1 hypothetical protein [Gilvimarinus agarilyticus]MDO6571477.1 hypothetical protein [Gilvimarinus sp. 2_MG-2023]MDO6747342.1 hypothetical protein [Gilvimarinus sp. 1_MG-2023]
MGDIHISDFHKDAARALNLLYSNFPRKITVFIEDIAGPDSPDEFGLHSPRHMACLATLLWLADEDYIRYDDTIRQEAVDQATLTHKGFTLLSGLISCRSQLSSHATHINGQLEPVAATGDIVGDFAPAIDLMRAALKGKSSSAIDTIMQILLTR